MIVAVGSGVGVAVDSRVDEGIGAIVLVTVGIRLSVEVETKVTLSVCIGTGALAGVEQPIVASNIIAMVKTRVETLHRSISTIFGLFILCNMIASQNPSQSISDIITVIAKQCFSAVAISSHRKRLLRQSLPLVSLTRNTSGCTLVVSAV